MSAISGKSSSESESESNASLIALTGVGDRRAGLACRLVFSRRLLRMNSSSSSSDGSKADDLKALSLRSVIFLQVGPRNSIKRADILVHKMQQLTRSVSLCGSSLILFLGCKILFLGSITAVRVDVSAEINWKELDCIQNTIMGNSGIVEIKSAILNMSRFR